MNKLFSKIKSFLLIGAYKTLVSFEKLINKSTKKGLEGSKFKINTPLINLSKKDIIKLGHKNGVDFSMTSSCYSPKLKKNCGVCDSCLLRKQGFEEAGLRDPAGI